MKILKQFFTATLIIITILIIGVITAYLLVSDTTLITWITRGVEHAAGSRISYGTDGRITRTLSPVLSMNDFVFEDENKSLKFNTSSLKIQVNLPGLLFGRLEIPVLALGDTRVELKKSDATERKKPLESLPIIPTFGDIQISQISLISENKEFNLSSMNIKEFSVKIKPDETDKLLLTLQTELAGNTFDVSTTLPVIHTILESQKLPFSLTINNEVSHISSDGLIDFSSTPPLIETRVQANAAKVPAFFSETLDPVTKIQLSTQISGNYKHLNLQECQIDVKTVNGLDIKIAGQLDLINNDSGLNPENINLSLIFAAPDTRSARLFFWDSIPEFGAIKGRVKIHSKKGDPSLENIVVTTRDKGGIQVDLKGRIARFPLDPDRSITGYDLDVIMTAEKISLMGERVGLDLPIEDPLNLTYRIQGDTQALQLNNIDFSAGKKDGDQISATGKILFGDWDKADPTESVDMLVNVKNYNTQTLGSIIGKELPELGAIKANARLHTVSQIHRIDDIQVQVGKAEPLLIKATGSADKIIFFPETSIEGVTLLATAAGEDTAALTDIFSLETVIPSMGSFKASAKITENQQKLGASELSFKSDLRDKGRTLIDLDINGQFKDFSKIDSLSLNTRIKAVDLRTIGVLFDQNWPAIGPVELNSLMKKEGEKLNFKTTMTVDEIEIKATNSVFFLNTPLRISGTIQAENFFFPGLADIEKKDDSKEEESDLYLFSRTPMNFDWLEKTDIDLIVDIKSFDKEKSRFKSAYFKVDLESGHLSILPAKLNFPRGNLELNVRFNTQNELKFNIEAFGKEINPYQALAADQSKIKDTFDADIDIDINITSYGLSQHELASNLDGNVYMIIKNGKLRKELLHLLFVDFVGWTLDKTAGKKYINIDCGVIDYKIKKGMVTTDAFFLSGDNMTVAGKGTIDLSNEQIDYVFLPKKKSVLSFGPEPVKLRGSLKNPSVTAIPWKSAVITYGSLIFSPYLFAGQVVIGLVTDIFKKKSEQSACMEYEKKHEQEQSSADPSTP
ncbi:MAG: AsmA family protein [Deltaproteobacteria bacterium]|nr:AsmA family protein [Deltaproteobacteria bacterium]